MNEFNSTKSKNATLALMLGIAAASGFRLPEYKPKQPKKPNPDLQAAAEAKRLRKQAKRINKNIN